MDPDKLAKQREELANAPGLCQFDLLSAEQLCQFAKDRDIPGFDADTVTRLWRAGLLRADLITSTSQLSIPSITLVSEDNGVYTYFDERQIARRDQGYGGVLHRTEADSNGVELLFHPFRLYVMYHICRVFALKISSTQYLLYPEGLITVARHEIDYLNQWSSRDECGERFDHWNRTAELAIVLEPIAYRAVFHSIRLRFPETETSLEAKLRQHRERTNEFLSEIDENEINDIRSELGRNAEMIDQNRLVHVLLRLMSTHERLKVRSALGACMLFLCMAETIRRAAEDALGHHLPEEDELGFGRWMAGARKSIYGSERVFDAPRPALRDFLTSMGLDYGTKVRCYVEGDTELGALTSAVGDIVGTEFLNLRGQVVEKGGRGLNFAGSLKNDMTSHVFSIVVLDEDRDDYVRALRKAAKDGNFFGRFFISSPDFEFANFTVGELVDVLLDLAQQRSDAAPARSAIMPLVASAKSGEQFFDLLRQPELSRMGKSEAWGVALMRLALRSEKLPQDHAKAGRVRPVIEVARLLVRGRDAGYLRSLDGYRVDPETGDLCKK